MDYQGIVETFQRAVGHHQSGAVAEAKASYEEVLEHSSAGGADDALKADLNLLFANTHNNLGVLLNIGGEQRDALDHFRQALDLSPGHVDALTNLGMIYLGQGNKEGAVDLLSQAVELHPEHLQARTSLGEAYASLGQHDLAVEAFGRALGASPPDARLVFKLGESQMGTGQFDAAVASFRSALEIDANHLPALMSLGRTLFLMQEKDETLQEKDEASTFFARAAELSPNDPVIHNNLGLCQQRNGEMETAKTSYRKALKIDPAFVDARGNLAALLLTMEEIDKARSLLKEGLSMDPGDRLLNLVAARCDREDGDPEKAIERLTKITAASENDRLSAEIFLELGKSHDMRNDSEKALQCFEGAEDIYATLPQSIYARKKEGE